MATDARSARIYNKKIAPVNTFKDGILDYLISIVEEESTNNWRIDGVFDTAAAITAVGNNMINIGAAAAIRAATGQGKTVKLNAADSRFQNINIPPDAAVVYHVGIEQSRVDKGIEINPRTTEAEYIEFIELPGRLGTPDSVVDNGDGTVTLTVNSITESGKDYSGRKVRVWLKSRTDGGIGPLATTEAVAIETRTIVYSAPNNRITTVAKFGQGAVSTTAADYRIMLEGPTVKRLGAEDLRNTAGVVFLGAVTSVAGGSPIVTIDSVDQNVIAFSMSDIDEVVRRDSHGDMKISVRADASDAEESQIEVLDSGGTVRWKVDEDGDISQIAGGRTVVQTLDPASARWSVDVNDANEWTYELRQLGAGSLNLVAPTLQQGAFGALQSGVISGLAISSGGGLSASMASGVAFIAGATGLRKVKASGATTLADASTNYVYLDSAGALQDTTSAATAFTQPNLPLAICVTAGGVITTITDIRRFFKPSQGHRHVTVGPDGAFASLIEALAWLKAVRAANASAWPDVELYLQGEQTYSAALIIDFPVTIRGGQEFIKWTHNGVLFQLATGSSGSKFIDIKAEFDRVGASLSSTFLTSGTASSVDDIVVQGCYLKTTSAASRNIQFFVRAQDASKRWLIQGNIIDDCALTPIALEDVDCLRFCIKDNNIELGANVAAAVAIQLSGISHRVQGNHIKEYQNGIKSTTNDVSGHAIQNNIIDGCDQSAIHINISDAVLITGNMITDCGTDGASTNGVIHVESTSGFVHIDGNTIGAWTGATMWGIRVLGGRAKITNNRVETPDATIAGGIKCEDTTDYLMVSGNYIELAILAASGDTVAGGVGIDLSTTGVAFSVVCNNFVRNCGTAASPGKGIWVYNGLVSGNLVDNVRGDGIRIENLRSVVVGNMVRDVDSGNGILFQPGADESVCVGNASLAMGGGANGIKFEAGCVDCFAQGNVVDTGAAAFSGLAAQNEDSSANTNNNQIIP